MKALMYHYVRPSDATLPHFRHLHINDFRRQLDYLAHRYGWLTREQFLTAIDTGRVPPGTRVLLTFDDGLKDHFTYVLPELQRRGLWGVFYIPTGMYSTRKLLDVHRIHLLLGQFGGGTILQALRCLITDEMLDDRQIKEFHDVTYRRQSNDADTVHVKRCLNYYVADSGHRTQILNELMQQFFPDEERLVDGIYMSEKELHKLHKAGMLLGSHTVTHPVMSTLSIADQAKEIADSFGFLDGLTGGPWAKTFCYPYGGPHTFTDATERQLAGSGCRWSFAVEPRDIDTRDLLARPQALPRYDCNLFPHGQCRNRN